MKQYIALDLETTGLNPAEDKIIEIGMAKVVDGEIIAQYQTLLNPQEQLSPRIVELTGITQDMVEEQPVIADVIEEIVAFIGDAPLLGHNIIFDFSFLKKACANAGIVLEKAGFDTLKIARRLLPEVEHKNLEYLCEHFHINPGNSHRAYDDAVSAHMLYLELAKIKPEDEGILQPTPLIFTVKKDTPITAAQKRYLTALCAYHNVTLKEDMAALTKSKASKLIDGIISEHGKIPYTNRSR